MFDWIKKGLGWVGNHVGLGGGNGGRPTPGMPNAPYTQGGYNSNPYGFSGRDTVDSTQPVIPDLDPGMIQKAKDWLSKNIGSLAEGLSTYEKWLIALQAVSGAAGAYTNYKQGEQTNALSKEELAEKQREFDLSQKTTAEQFAQNLKEQQRQFNVPQGISLSRSQDAAPLRDRAMYLMSNRLGQSPGQFSGATLTQPMRAGSGINLQAMADANNMYSPWAGGTKPGVDYRQKILDSLGYGS